jgi:hypothetical protein
VELFTGSDPLAKVAAHASRRFSCSTNSSAGSCASRNRPCASRVGIEGNRCRSTVFGGGN